MVCDGPGCPVEIVFWASVSPTHPPSLVVGQRRPCFCPVLTTPL